MILYWYYALKITKTLKTHFRLEDSICGREHLHHLIRTKLRFLPYTILRIAAIVNEMVASNYKQERR